MTRTIVSEYTAFGQPNIIGEWTQFVGDDGSTTHGPWVNLKLSKDDNGRKVLWFDFQNMLSQAGYIEVIRDRV